jgi:hypothetical protein
MISAPFGPIRPVSCWRISFRADSGSNTIPATAIEMRSSGPTENVV